MSDEEIEEIITHPEEEEQFPPETVLMTILEAAQGFPMTAPLIDTLPTLEGTMPKAWIAVITGDDGRVIKSVEGNTQNDLEKQMLINQELEAIDRTTKIYVKRIISSLVIADIVEEVPVDPGDEEAQNE